MKRNRDPPKEHCQYGTSCYRKNPHHFREYKHEHLEKIIRDFDKTTGKYIVPSEMAKDTDVFLEQISILLQLFPNMKESVEAMPQKKLAIDSAATGSTSKTIVPNTPENKPLFNAETVANAIKGAIISNKNTNLSLPSTSKDERFTSPQSSSARSPSTPMTKNIHDYIPVVLPKGQMAAKLEAAAPYNYFLTAITSSPATHKEPLTVTLQEILDPSLGELECSMHMNFMIDIGWLLGHYYFAGVLDKPMLVLYGDESADLLIISKKKPHITAIKVQMANPFGIHHTKMMLLGYKDGSMRVVISTANLYEDDWHNRTQGLWISPKLEAVPDDCDAAFGESPTMFRGDLIQYLSTYNIGRVQPWIARIRKSNFTKVNVCFVASTPGSHDRTPTGHLWGHPRLGHLLSKHSAPISETSPIVAQSSSIGSLGPTPGSWMLGEISNSFSCDSTPRTLRKLPDFKMIYPTYENVRNSHDNLLGGGCLPYGMKIHDKQPWLNKYLCQWKAKERHRNQAMPHIKTYCRWSDRGMYWFLLTSANLSKAAWGVYNKTGLNPRLRINSYEVGVLFLPKFVTGGSFFPMKEKLADVPPFPVTYDIPLTPYTAIDSPFFSDYLTQ